MPQRRLSVRKAREILRLKFDQQLGNRPISRTCKVSPSTVSDCLARFRQSGLSWPLPEEFDDDEQLERRLYPGQPEAKARRPEPDWHEVKRELRKKHVTLQLLWEEYRDRHPDGYGRSWFCREYGEYRQRLDVVMRQSHKLGEKAFVDFAGDTVDVTDPETGEVRRAQVYVGVLGASSYTYAEACWSQDIPNWIRAHVRMLEYFGGAPEIIVPDNLKSGVTKPDYYDPDINLTYQEFAEYYHVAILPARIRKPRDKAKVESAVGFAERRILAALRNRTFYSLGELNEAIWRKLEELNDRPFQKLPGSRRSIYEQEERAALQPLPARPFRFELRKRARVHIDYHVEIERHCYSVPYHLAREQVEVRLAPATVEIFHRGKRVAVHTRSYAAGRSTTLLEHMPERHRRRAEWTPERFVSWARKTGPYAAELIEKLLGKYQPPELGFRSCLGVLRLSGKYGDERLEAACRLALQQGCIRYRSVKSILDRGLDQQEPLADQQRLPTERRVHENVRGADYYH